jgi:hypothetical protein
MVKPHKHAAVIKAWADGAEIECRSRGADRWIPTEYPAWHLDVEYRVKPEPHKWQKEMDAYYLHRKNIQCRGDPRHSWTTWDGVRSTGTIENPDPRFNDPHFEFRIKPEQVVKYAWAHPANAAVGWREIDANLKLTFEDGKLIKAEVLNVR